MKIKLEKDLYGPFGRWVATKYNGPTAVFELKLAKNNRVNIKSDFKDHQIRLLKMVKKNSLYWKIPDVGIQQKPFDSFYLKNELAYAVICFDNRMYFIDIERIVSLPEERKSITEIDCDALCEFKDTL